jgi:hypothetical protein
MIAFLFVPIDPAGLTYNLVSWTGMFDQPHMTMFPVF